MQTPTIIVATIALAALGVLSGCQQTTAPTADNSSTGTYTAARHSALGSNIPQPDSVNTAGYRYDGGVAAATGGLSTLTPSQAAAGAR